jgi:hypothetical protein
MASTNDTTDGDRARSTSQARNDVAASRSEAEGALQGVMSTAQDAADRVRTVASGVAEQLPGAMATAQSAATDTARTLDQMPNQALMLGAAFSLGLGAGLFITGSNRLLVLLSLAPAAAMAATLAGRDPDLREFTSRATSGGRATT